MTSRETQLTTTATDPSHEHADDPIPKEMLREGGDVEDPQTGKPQTVTDAKATQTQPAHIDAGSEQAEHLDGADNDDEEEKEEPEEEPEEDGPPRRKWRTRGPPTFGNSRGGNPHSVRGKPK
ncbi:hypothetical protein PTI98_008631 [Pleurotus ostreatus]|nr:hypothetical protein PTI98_008631 [Pleurotus ostreatus]